MGKLRPLKLVSVLGEQPGGLAFPISDDMRARVLEGEVERWEWLHLLGGVIFTLLWVVL